MEDLDRLFATIEQEKGHLDVSSLMRVVAKSLRLDQSLRNTLTKPLTQTSKVCCSPCRRHCRCCQRGLLSS
jgi:hypothetical protein